MKEQDFVSPSTTRNGFHCPHCGTYAHHIWYSPLASQLNDNSLPIRPSDNELERHFPEAKTRGNRRRNRSLVAADLRRRYLRTLPIMLHVADPRIAWKLGNAWFSKCERCQRIVVWIGRMQVWPLTGTAPRPHPDMPDNVRQDYEEARATLDHSPRAAAALLRLSVDNLCIHLEAKGRTLNERIGSLVADGLPLVVSQSLDTVRVTGNAAVHPGKIAQDDDRETVIKLFWLVNFIVRERISRLQEISDLYDSLPEDKRRAIAERDDATRG